jgi:hypothetical protein
LRYEHYLLTSLDGLANELGGSKNIVETMLSRDDMHVFGISIRRFTEDGQEYWSAREMAGFLGYSSWVAFRKVIARVERILLENNLYVPEDFRHTTLTVLARHDSLRQIEDIHLSRTGFLHVLQGADSTKTMVDIGKSYIARRMLEREDLDEYRRLFGNRDMQSSTVLTHQSQQRLRRPQGASESASHT